MNNDIVIESFPNVHIKEYHHRMKSIPKEIIEDIEGIVEVISHNYSLWVKKSTVYRWEEIEPKIIARIKEVK